MNEIFTKLHTLLVVNYHFHTDQIQLDTDFEKELGTDSREMLELISDIEKIFNIEIDFDDIDNFIYSGQTVKVSDVVHYIEKKLNLQK